MSPRSTIPTSVSKTVKTPCLMNIIQKKWAFLHSTAFHVPPQAKKLYVFGLAVLTARSINSLRSNARILSLNWNTAKSKAYRITKNIKLLQVFPGLVRVLCLVSPHEAVAVDFSDFGSGYQVLMFAKQTGKGRALPLYFEILHYPIEKNSQNLFIMKAIGRFTTIVGCQPLLVFDRGFACPAIIQFLQENQHQFVIRIKGGKHIQSGNGRMLAARCLQRNDALVLVYGHRLRLIVSDEPENGAEPWYLVTNSATATRATIIRIYYHRFEIEEFFRDAKRLLGLEWVNCKTAQTLSIVLWFVILGIWCLAHLETLLDALERKQRVNMRLSSIRFLFEQLQTASFLAAESRFYHELFV